MRLKYEFSVMDLSDEKIAVPIGSEANLVLKLNEEGKVILDMLQKDTEETEIVEKISLTYSVDKNQLSEYVHSFISTLRKANLIVD